METAVLPLLPLSRVPLLAFVAFAACLFLITGLRAANIDRPEDVVRRLLDNAVIVLSEESMNSPLRDARLRKLLTTYFDLNRISRFVLGRHWQNASRSERAEYRRLFEDYIMVFYGVRLARFTVENISVGSSTEHGEGGAIVASMVHGIGTQPVNVDWRLTRRAGKWRVIDLVVGGISMAITQRSEFDSVISKSGGRIETLLTKLREFPV